ncbi:CBS domain-containing protein [Paracoccus aurantiacus]|uniref:CBS domain-containing protein n=1 Tax=Paracoccus aurantiacus TaxID=2599412 RepID=A0A5C6S8B5_9RHOB|nr:HPP family protein [Paracoccus aurantiacus]TXB69992.1 CBS domain-containing protein [Paracoccus aurantiacus]
MRNPLKLLEHLNIRALGPVASVPAAEALRASLGAFVGLTVTAVVAFVVSPDRWLALYLIAPFGATAVLVFAAPNSPLAQPWPAIVGNTASALTAILLCRVLPDPLISVPLAVGLAIAVMAALRATHPPGGAVAMTVALGADRILPSGFGFALLPVAAGTIILVATAAIYAQLTGRRYPLRQFGEVNPQGTHDPAPVERLGLTEDELTEILSRYRQSLNLGVEDLARLIGAAEMQAASHMAGPQTAQAIMSRDLVTVAPDTDIEEIAALFLRHGFTSLPVVDADGRFLGVIFQLQIIAAAFPGHELTAGHPPPLAVSGAARAADIMDPSPPSAGPETPLAALLPQLAGSVDAVPILDAGRIVGVVTQTDLIAALARESLRGD